MPYIDPSAKKENAEKYRKANRALLAANERARTAARTPHERAKHYAKKKEYVAAKKAAGTYNREPERRSARAAYNRLSKDPQFRQKATARAREWVEKNRDKANATWRKIRSHRIATDVCYRLVVALRSRFYMAVKNNHKSGTAIRELGCSVEDFRAYIEMQFQPGMTWDNWSNRGWHIDHKRPLCSFDLSNPDHLKMACHYTNLQPLWAKDNESKGGKA